MYVDTEERATSFLKTSCFGRMWKALFFKESWVNIFVALVSFVLGFLAIFPIYRYFYNSVISNAKEYDGAYKKEFDKDPAKAFVEDFFLRKRGAAYGNVQKFVFANVAVFFVPITLNAFIACGFYFLFIWIL